LATDLRALTRIRLWSIRDDPRKSVASAFCWLALAASDHQARSDDHQQNAHAGWDSLLIVRRNPHMRVSDPESVMLVMRKRRNKRQHSQHQHYHPDQH
jgi:hypothetical protein